MKIYTVELKRTSYITMTIEAESKDEAEMQAWRELEMELETDGSWGIKYANWDIESIEENEE